MGFFSNLFSGGLYSLTDNDYKAMAAKEGCVRFAIRYVGGHINFPSAIEAVVELSLANSPDFVINVYANLSSAGLEVQPGQCLFSIPYKKITAVQSNNTKEFSGAFLIGGLGAVLQETRYFIAIAYRDDSNIKHNVVFGTTPAVKSEAYFGVFYKSFIGTLLEVNPDALSGENDNSVDLASKLEKLSQLKEKGMLTDEEFIAAKTKLLNGEANESRRAIHDDPVITTAVNNAPPAVQRYKVKIKGPDDSKKMYLATKDFYKDAGVAFEKAKESLTKGIIMTFEDKKQAMQFIEKYNQMGCKTELIDS